MLMNGCHAVLRGIEELKKYDLNNPVRVMDMEMEQKWEQNTMGKAFNAMSLDKSSTDILPG